MKGYDLMEEQSVDFRAVGKAVIFSLAITFLLLFIFAAILYTTSVSDELIPGTVSAITSFSLLTGGILASSKASKSGFLHGGLVAVGYFIVILIGSLISNNGFIFNSGMLTTLLFSIASGMLGGIIGINLKQKKKKHR